MALTYLLAPIPRWVILDQFGTTAGGAKLYTYFNRDRVTKKPVYQNSSGTLEWSNPITFDENGTEGPFYWKVNSADLDDTYYLEAYDSNDELLWTIPDYFPPGEGGGGNVTTYVSLNNLINNNVFLNHVGDIASPTNTTNVVLAPSNHKGLVEVATATGGAVGPDIRFIKNITTAADTISFVPFTLASNPLTGDVTPPIYVRYTSNLVLGESYKCFQFPVCQDVKNLDNQEMSVTCWARAGAGTESIKFYFRQYFGSGGTPSADVRTDIHTEALTTTWTQIRFTFTSPSIAGKTTGDCGDDACYLQIEMPLSEACDIYFIKPCLFIGNVEPTSTFETYDEISSIAHSARTGDVRISLNSFQPFGWVPANDGTIGSSSSNATTRANIDTFPLYATIWNAMQTNQSYAPMYTSAGAATAYGASAIVDYSADNQLSLTKALGQVFAGTSPIYNTAQTWTVVAATDLITVATSAVRYGTGTPVILTNSGGALPTSNPQVVTGTTYYTVFQGATTLKLATTLENALSGTVIDFTGTGTGTQSIQEKINVMGLFRGEESHTLIKSELPDPLTTTVGLSEAGLSGGGDRFKVDGTLGSGIVPNSGGNNGHNTMQPTTYMNVFFKL